MTRQRTVSIEARASEVLHRAIERIDASQFEDQVTELLSEAKGVVVGLHAAFVIDDESAYEWTEKAIQHAESRSAHFRTLAQMTSNSTI